MLFPLRRCAQLPAILAGCVAAFCVPGAVSGGEPPISPHWAFQPPKRADLRQGGASSIDAILAMERGGRELMPQPAAAPALWLRRVHLDLTGLPPSLEDLAGRSSFRVSSYCAGNRLTLGRSGEGILINKVAGK